jgi:hypothetical protein
MSLKTPSFQAMDLARAWRGHFRKKGLFDKVAIQQAPDGHTAAAPFPPGLGWHCISAFLYCPGTEAQP